MTSWADTYREKEPNYKTLKIEALAHIGPVKVIRNAALKIFDILTTDYDATDFEAETMSVIFKAHGIEVLRKVALAVYVEPRIARDEADREENGGLLFEELDIAYHNAIFKAINEDFSKAGEKKAAPFPGGEDGSADRSGELPVGDDPEPVPGA